MNLKAKVSSAGGIYKKYSARLEKLGINTFEDFLFHIPFRYEDYSLKSEISQIQGGEIITIEGKVDDIRNIFTRGYRKIQRAIVSDETGKINVVWFNQPYLAKTISKGDRISLSGKVERGKSGLSFVSPEFEILDSDSRSIHTGRLVPVYPETRGISSKWLRKQVDKLLSLPSFGEHLPKDLIIKNDLLDFDRAIREIHFPKSLEEARKAKERLSFDELLITQAKSHLRKIEWSKKTVGRKLKLFEKEVGKFIEKLPFELTSAQKKAVSEILHDLSSDKPMNRLLEGDVGSGKTVVGAIASYLAHLNKLQTAFIAPTEILANQHLSTLRNLLVPLGMKVELITSKNKLKTSEFDILVGTHAIISDKIKFKDLGLVIIDEQQRFGVEQRGILRKKGDNPHVLTMTATPIPRTVALTLYGELDLTILDELPKGRQIIKTWLVPKQKRSAAYGWIEKQIEKNGTQAFIICPFIEESESAQTVRAATKEFDYLSKNIFKNLRLGLLHGKQKSKERDEVLSHFSSGKLDILVATPIVEVGIDIPNATMILVEAAERFGLAQLHQLRGRVGRGSKQSYCLLFTESDNPMTINRLKAMEVNHIGAVLSELDLKLRGAGDIYGTKQHGQTILKIASLSDFDLIERTKEEAKKLTENIEKYPMFYEKIKEIDSREVSPD